MAQPLARQRAISWISRLDAREEAAQGAERELGLLRQDHVRRVGHDDLLAGRQELRELVRRGRRRRAVVLAAQDEDRLREAAQLGAAVDEPVVAARREVPEDLGAVDDAAEDGAPVLDERTLRVGVVERELVVEQVRALLGVATIASRAQESVT